MNGFCEICRGVGYTKREVIRFWIITRILDCSHSNGTNFNVLNVWQASSVVQHNTYSLKVLLKLAVVKYIVTQTKRS